MIFVCMKVLFARPFMCYSVMDAGGTCAAYKIDTHPPRTPSYLLQHLPLSFSPNKADWSISVIYVVLLVLTSEIEVDEIFTMLLEHFIA